MSLLKQLTRWKIRGQIDQDVIDIILTLQSRLEHHWRIDVSHSDCHHTLIAYCQQPCSLKNEAVAFPHFINLFMMKCKVRSFFPDVLEIHHDLLSFIPQDIPEAEQSYYLANIYSLLLEQDKK